MNRLALTGDVYACGYRPDFIIENDQHGYNHTNAAAKVVAEAIVVPTSRKFHNSYRQMFQRLVQEVQYGTILAELDE